MTGGALLIAILPGFRPDADMASPMQALRVEGLLGAVEWQWQNLLRMERTPLLRNTVGPHATGVEPHTLP